ncbi:MAG: hypothetical protein J3K34DRAFT_417430 [Monoraphidium minutum]|nr:MAG: hypothetical protein J3K34DRAFT_417430 [Monoraphidium minutum]
MQANRALRGAGQASRARMVRCEARRSRPGDSGLILNPRGSPQTNRQSPNGPPGLILPGQPGAPGGPPGRGGAQRLMLPSDRPLGGGGVGTGLAAPGADEPLNGPGGDRPLPNRYRPPAGFMDDAPGGDAEAVSLSDDEMISKLRSRAGHWYQLAKLIPALAAKGYDSNALDEAAGITPAEQNLWMVAGTVYDSLAASAAAAAAPGLLQHFEHGGDELLYHFRFLPAVRRVDAAQYIAANNLSPQECEVLARSMKEWDRRPGERAGFDATAADCLAFKYMRDAIECRFSEEAFAKLDQAVATAVSDGARARLQVARKELEETHAAKAGGAGSVSSGVMLTLLRLSPDELGVRPLPQLADLGAATAADLAAAPAASQEGAFGAFTIAAGAAGAAAAHRWVALPQWKALSLARRPAALGVPDCSRDAAIIAASQVKTDEDKKRLSGPGLLVVDAHFEGELDPKGYYLVSADSGALQLADGPAAAAAVAARRGKVAAEVLFLARPPSRDHVSAVTSELLQV